MAVTEPDAARPGATGAASGPDDAPVAGRAKGPHLIWVTRVSCLLPTIMAIGQRDLDTFALEPWQAVVLLMEGRIKHCKNTTDPVYHMPRGTLTGWGERWVKLTNRIRELRQ